MPTPPVSIARFCSLAVLCCLAASCGGSGPEGPLVADGWPQWRGPDGAGRTPVTGLPVEWSPDSDNIRWRTQLTNFGTSQPIATDGRIFLTAARGEPGAIERLLEGYDLATGERLWVTPIFTASHEKTHDRFGSYAMPTPASDGETVWAYYGGYLAAVSRDGELRWKTVVDSDYWSYSRYGAASSPVVVGRAVVVFSDNEWGEEKQRPDSTWIAAFDRDTGEQLWRHAWTDTCCSYSTPVVRKSPGGYELIFSTTPIIFAVDALTGERLWQLDLPIVQVVPSLVLEGDLLIQAGSVHQRKTYAYRLTGFGTETTGEKLWEAKRGVPQMGSPVIYDGLLFSVSPIGVLTCYEPESGQVLWQKRLPQGDYRGSLVAGDGKIYATTLGGKTAVVAAERKYRLLAANKLGEVSESSMAVTEECLIIRTYPGLYCIATDA